MGGIDRASGVARTVVVRSTRRRIGQPERRRAAVGALGALCLAIHRGVPRGVVVILRYVKALALVAGGRQGLVRRGRRNWRQRGRRRRGRRRRGRRRGRGRRRKDTHVAGRVRIGLSVRREVGGRAGADYPRVGRTARAGVVDAVDVDAVYVRRSCGRLADCLDREVHVACQEGAWRVSSWAEGE